ncbi:hypothetical protein OGH69_10500 [Flavobacterium sp. MFBS3-15]|uniref:hypothetical protein n=1 Tax=Flavobacterium sp. MFBS3-15 TaxID=2989816 RepID=UPI00223614C3|nr:hypothetical protein [Flavobacterium sp. MFBS3-15]MCW4469396.1 hypothetical protein [Flavobacterium sp. MFBS3-15]
MSTLAGTTWTFSTQGDMEGTIEFIQNGPSQNAGVANITATNPPMGCTPGTFQAAWAEVADGNYFAVQFSDFMPTLYPDSSNGPDSYLPPPLGIPTINAGQYNAQPVTLFGQHTDGVASMFGTNFQTEIPANNHVMMAFTMTKQ